MSSTPPDLAAWLDGLARDPDVFVHQLDAVNRRLLLVRLSAQQIAEAAFLDQRALGGQEPGAWVPLDKALAAAVPSAAPQGLILHCGHAGSTLVSRLLGELPGTRVLREPLILQALAEEMRAQATPLARLRPEEFEAALNLSQCALAKAPAETPAVFVKHTSLTANLASRLLARPHPPRVLCLWIPLTDYLATMLREPGLREGVRLAAGSWIRDLLPVLKNEAPVLGACSDAELAALNWCAAQLAFARARATAPEHVIGHDFGTFLADPERALHELTEHFGLTCSDDDIARALYSPWLRRYAKDPRYPFDAEARTRELEAARTQFAAELHEGLAFAHRLWPRLPLEPAYTCPK